VARFSRLLKSNFNSLPIHYWLLLAETGHPLGSAIMTADDPNRTSHELPLVAKSPLYSSRDREQQQ